MFKKGFTLAEVLVTLAIVGVIAALTIPTVMQNAGSAKVGPTLSKFVSSFETASQKKMIESESTTMTINQVFEKEIDDMLEYFPMSPYNGDNIEIKYPTGEQAFVLLPKYTGSGSQEGNSGDRIYVAKDGLIVAFGAIDKVDAKACSKGYKYKSYKGCVGTAVVITNAANTKHYLGKDTFYFLLDDSGAVVPYGSGLFKQIMDANKQTAYANVNCNLKLGEYKAADGDSAAKVKEEKANNIKSLAACTGKIADNGWKVFDK